MLTVSVFSLVQILSSLLIPTIALSAHEYKNGPLPEVIFRKPNGPALFRPLLHAWWNFKQRRLSRIQTDYETRGPIFDQMVRDALGILMRGLPMDSIMNEDFVGALLLRFGEVERAQNPGLVREMAEAARSTSGNFDEEALINALSSDLADWDVTPGRVSTFFEDVFGTPNPDSVSRLESEDITIQEVDEEVTPEPENDKGGGANSPDKRLFVTSALFNMDMVVDANMSLWSMVMIWVFYFLR